MSGATHLTQGCQESARQAESQATARYQTGLATALEVADAQRVLAQAEIEDALARLQVRRALLLAAEASGDLTTFLAAVGGTGKRD